MPGSLKLSLTLAALAAILPSVSLGAALEAPPTFRFVREAADASTAPKAPLGAPALDELATVLAERASPAVLAELARYRPACLSWKPTALHVDCGRPRADFDQPTQSLFLATKFIVMMYGSRGYLVYVPAAPARIANGDDIRRAAISMRDFLRAVEAAQLIQAQRQLEQARNGSLGVKVSGR